MRGAGAHRWLRPGSASADGRVAGLPSPKARATEYRDAAWVVGICPCRACHGAFEKTFRHSPTLVILAAIQPAPGTGDRQRGIPLTVSIGVALHAAGDTAGAVLQRADEAMYLAKQRGRTRVEVWAGVADAPGAVGRAAAQAA